MITSAARRKKESDNESHYFTGICAIVCGGWGVVSGVVCGVGCPGRAARGQGADDPAGLHSLNSARKPGQGGRGGKPAGLGGAGDRAG